MRFSPSDKRIPARHSYFQSLTFLLSLWLQVSGIIIQLNIFTSWDTPEKMPWLTLEHKAQEPAEALGDSIAFNQLGMILLRLQY